MPKRTRIYTRAGDDGTTGLIGGERVAKNSMRIETYGTIDELSSAVGVARAHLTALADADAGIGRLDAWLAWTQNLLFDLGAELATPGAKRWKGMPLANNDQVRALERAIDEADAELEPLSAFILPSGHLAAASLHLARTICRRAERLLITLREEEPEIPDMPVHVLNRLSDALFVWARWINRRTDSPETLWQIKAAPPEPLEK